MLLSFRFLIKLRDVWEMLIQSSVKSGRNLLYLFWEGIYYVTTFPRQKFNIYRSQITGLGTWKAEDVHQNSRKGHEMGSQSACLELSPVEN